MQSSSPKSGVFNKLKKKLTKGRRYEIASGEDPDASGCGKLQKLEAIYGKLPTSQDGGVVPVRTGSRDSSPGLCESPQRTLSESPQRGGGGSTPTKRNSSADSPQRSSLNKRNVLESPQRANLSEKDTNKTNTYTKDPTKDQLKKTGSGTIGGSDGSPVKEPKNNGGNKSNYKSQSNGEDGPIIFINNTYDLPPIVPVKKGAISDRRQRSRERKEQHANGAVHSKDQDGVSGDENKENSKAAACKSPSKITKREKLNSTKSPSRQVENTKSPTRQSELMKSPTRKPEIGKSPSRQSSNCSAKSENSPDKNNTTDIRSSSGLYESCCKYNSEVVSTANETEIEGKTNQYESCVSKAKSSIDVETLPNGFKETEMDNKGQKNSTSNRNSIVVAGINTSRGLIKPIVAAIPTVPTMVCKENKDLVKLVGDKNKSNCGSKSLSCTTTGNEASKSNACQSNKTKTDELKQRSVCFNKLKLVDSSQPTSEIVAISAVNDKNSPKVMVNKTKGNGPPCLTSFLSPEKGERPASVWDKDTSSNDLKVDKTNSNNERIDCIIGKKVVSPTKIVRVFDSTMIVKAGGNSKPTAVIVNLQQQPKCLNFKDINNKNEIKRKSNAYVEASSSQNKLPTIGLEDDLPPPPAYMLDFSSDNDVDNAFGDGGCGGLNCFNGMIGAHHINQSKSSSNPENKMTNKQPTKVVNSGNCKANKPKPLPPPRKSSSGDFSSEKPILFSSKPPEMSTTLSSSTENNLKQNVNIEGLKEKQSQKQNLKFSISPPLMSSLKESDQCISLKINEKPVGIDATVSGNRGTKPLIENIKDKTMESRQKVRDDKDNKNKQANVSVANKEIVQNSVTLSSNDFHQEMPYIMKGSNEKDSDLNLVDKKKTGVTKPGKEKNIAHVEADKCISGVKKENILDLKNGVNSKGSTSDINKDKLCTNNKDECGTVNIKSQESTINDPAYCSSSRTPCLAAEYSTSDKEVQQIVNATQNSPRTNIQSQNQQQNHADDKQVKTDIITSKHLNLDNRGENNSDQLKFIKAPSFESVKTQPDGLTMHLSSNYKIEKISANMKEDKDNNLEDKLKAGTCVTIKDGNVKNKGTSDIDLNESEKPSFNGKTLSKVNGDIDSATSSGHIDDSKKEKYPVRKDTWDSNEYIGIEEYALVTKKRLEFMNSDSSGGSQESVDIGYTSLADVEKIFGKKCRPTTGKSTSGPVPRFHPIVQKKENGDCEKGNEYVKNIDNIKISMMKGHMTKCDVNPQGCDVTSVRGSNVKNKPAAPLPPAALIMKTTFEESEYGSIGDYSSNKKLVAAQNSGARPKEKVINPSDDYVDAPPINTFLLVAKDTSKITNNTNSYQDASLDLSSRIKRERTRDSSSSSNLDVNINVEVERGISHESGYETAGSGLRSHSSSSNEFIQNDSSSYSLMSEQGNHSRNTGAVGISDEPVEINGYQIGNKNIMTPVTVDLNDSTSSEESAEMRRRPVYRDTLQKRDSPAIVASLYAYIPKGQHSPGIQEKHLTSSTDTVVSEGLESEQSNAITDNRPMETILRSTLHSPCNVTNETVLDDIDSEAYTDEVDYGFEDCDCEDDDYLPPIPTRNYNSEERDTDGKGGGSKSGAGGNLNEDLAINHNTPPLMRVILNNKDKITLSTKNSKIRNLSSSSSTSMDSSQSTSVTDNSITMKSSTVKGNTAAIDSNENIKDTTKIGHMLKTSDNSLFKSVKINNKSVVPDLEPAIVVATATVQQKHCTSSSNNNNNKDAGLLLDEEDVFLDKMPDINEGLLAKVKNAVSGKSLGLTVTISSTGSSNTDISYDNSAKETLSTMSKTSPKSKNSVMRCLQSITQTHGGSKAFKCSPIKRKSYERVERSTPVKDIEAFSEPRSPKKRETKSKHGSRSFKKLFTNSSKESLDKSNISLASLTTKEEKQSTSLLKEDLISNEPLDLSKKTKDKSNDSNTVEISKTKVINDQTDHKNIDNKVVENDEVIKKSKETPVKQIDIESGTFSGMSNNKKVILGDGNRHKVVPDTPSKFSERSDMTELYNASFSSDSTLSLDHQFWASFDEPVHMSIDEVITQAKDLGIPLTLTRSANGARQIEDVINQANDLGIPLSMSRSGGRVVYRSTSTQKELEEITEISATSSRSGSHWSGSETSTSHRSRHRSTKAENGMHNNSSRTSESDHSISSIDSVSSPNRGQPLNNTQTLPCPKHGHVITPDKLPRKKPGTLKDKFASLFAKKSGSISPSKQSSLGSENIQKRSLPPPPTGNNCNSGDLDVVDGTSPSRRHRHKNFHDGSSNTHNYPKSLCEVHHSNHTISSPGRSHHCNTIFHSNNHQSNTIASHSRHNERCRCSPSGKKGICEYCSNTSPRNFCNGNKHGHQDYCGCTHSKTTLQNSKPCTKYNRSSIEKCDCGCEDSEIVNNNSCNSTTTMKRYRTHGNRNHHSNSNHHHNIGGNIHRQDNMNNTKHRRHQSSSRVLHDNSNQNSQHTQQAGICHKNSSSGGRHHRDRSESREDRRTSSRVTSQTMSRSRSPHMSSNCSDDSPVYPTAPAKHTRSSSSSGIVDRCPSSPAPSTGTSSVLSAPSTFTYPPAGGLNGTGGSSRDALVSSITSSFLRDCSPTRSVQSSSTASTCNNNSISGNADFIGSLSKLKDVGWYWGPLSWDDAEAKLSTKPDGSFLVRDSSDDRYILSLSFRSQGTTHHTRIEHYKGMFSFYSQPKSHGAATIIEFVEKAMDHSRSGKFLYFLRPRAPGLPPAPVQLLYPISRFHNMQTLQHLCRFSILKHVRRDHIDQLPVPQRIKDYLEMSQYYIEYLGDDTAAR